MCAFHLCNREARRILCGQPCTVLALGHNDQSVYPGLTHFNSMYTLILRFFSFKGVFMSQHLNKPIGNTWEAKLQTLKFNCSKALLLLCCWICMSCIGKIHTCKDQHCASQHLLPPELHDVYASTYSTDIKPTLNPHILACNASPDITRHDIVYMKEWKRQLTAYAIWLDWTGRKEQPDEDWTCWRKVSSSKVLATPIFNMYTNDNHLRLNWVCWG